MSHSRPSRRIWRALAAVALLALAGNAAHIDARPVTPDAPSPFRLEGDGIRLRFTGKKRALVPIYIENNHLWSRGAVNGKDSVSILFDTGAYNDCVRTARAASLGLELRGRHQSLGAGGSVESASSERVTLGMQGVDLVGDRLNTLPLEEIGGQAGRDLDVIVGYPLFARAVVVIDYEAATLEIIDGADWRYEGSGVVLPLTFESRLPYVTARVTLPGRDAVEGRFVLDTGSAGSLILGPEFVEQQHALDVVGTTVQGLARGVGGQSANPVGRVAKLELGRVALDRPITMFRSPGPGSISAPGTIGNIGGGILRRFRVFLDYSRSRVILEPNARFGDPFEYDMSGLGLRATGPNYSQVMVARVLEESPAAAAAVRAGDELVSVDGESAREIGLDRLRTMFRREGAEHRLEMKRGEETLRIVLKTRRLI
jgi:hypothetical protein